MTSHLRGSGCVCLCMSLLYVCVCVCVRGHVQANGVRDRQAYKEKVIELAVEGEKSEWGCGKGWNEKEQCEANEFLRLPFLGIILPPSVRAQNNICCQSAPPSPLPTFLKQTAFTQTKHAQAASSQHVWLWFEFIVWHYKLDSRRVYWLPKRRNLTESSNAQSQRKNVRCQSNID